MKRIHVVAGVIYNPACDEVLLARRKANQHQGGLWEFPGGKVESGEAPREALIRELTEEVGITARELAPLIEVPWEYTDKRILLEVYEITAFSGTAQGQEGQEVRWVPATQLADYEFPEANLAIIEKIQAG